MGRTDRGGYRGIEVGARMGSLVFERSEGHRIWARCDCGRQRRMHRSEWRPGLKCEGEEHGLLARWRAHRAADGAAQVKAPNEKVATREMPLAKCRNYFYWTDEQRREVDRQRVERARALIGTRFCSVVVVGVGTLPGSIVIECDCGTLKEKPAKHLHQAKSCGCIGSSRMAKRGTRRLLFGARSVAPSSESDASKVRRAELRQQALDLAIAKAAERTATNAPQPAPQPAAPPKPLELTTQQRAVLLQVQRGLDERGYAPSIGEIAEALQSHAQPFVPVAECLTRLEVKGYIERSHVSARTIKVLRPIAEGN